jgi:hypothetical protein
MGGASEAEEPPSRGGPPVLLQRWGGPAAAWIACPAPAPGWHSPVAAAPAPGAAETLPALAAARWRRRLDPRAVPRRPKPLAPRDLSHLVNFPWSLQAATPAKKPAAAAAEITDMAEGLVFAAFFRNLHEQLSRAGGLGSFASPAVWTKQSLGPRRRAGRRCRGSLASRDQLMGGTEAENRSLFAYFTVANAQQAYNQARSHIFSAAFVLRDVAVPPHKAACSPQRERSRRMVFGCAACVNSSRECAHTSGVCYGMRIGPAGGVGRVVSSGKDVVCGHPLNWG